MQEGLTALCNAGVSEDVTHDTLSNHSACSSQYSVTRGPSKVATLSRDCACASGTIASEVRTQFYGATSRGPFPPKRAIYFVEPRRRHLSAGLETPLRSVGPAPPPVLPLEAHRLVASSVRAQSSNSDRTRSIG
jgi:hypothetical protein